MNFLYKLYCIFLYHSGDLACRLGDYNLYQFLMLKSVEINDQHNLKIWKEVDKSLDES
jgi:hypothetical protein